jgi:redox-sensitive bicupin YhaK (pirin superfamily)
MIALRKSRERGYADHGWLRSHHSFSFAGYHDPRHMGFGNLRVINEDHIAPGTGFGAHGHKDSMGNEQTISPGEVQRMSAGSGVVHSEHNHAPGQNTHFLQIWLLPSETGMAPGYAQKAFADAEKRGRLRLVASPDGAESSVTVHADARLYAGLFDGNEHAELDLPAGRKTYVHLVRGALSVNGQRLTAGDAALVENEPQLCLENGVQSEVLVFDLQA